MQSFALEIERRTAASKGEIFEPLVRALGEMCQQIAELEDEEELPPDWFAENVMPAWKEFMTWVQIYGSDETVWLVHRYMQAAFAEAPVFVTMRLLAEVVIAARKELGHPETKVTALDIMGMRINDIYANGVAAHWARLPEAELHKEEGWTPPWGNRFRFGKPLNP